MIEILNWCGDHPILAIILLAIAISPLHAFFAAVAKVVASCKKPK